MLNRLFGLFILVLFFGIAAWGYQTATSGMVSGNLIDLALGMIGITIIIVVLVYFFLLLLGRNPSLRAVAIISVSMAIVVVFGLYAYLRISRPSDDVLTAVSGVCQGHGSPLAKSYAGNQTHLIVLLDNQGKPTELSARLPNEWRPSSIESTELVACVSREKKLLESCPYTGGKKVERYQSFLNIRLLEANTATLLRAETLNGSSPDQCDPQESFKLYQSVNKNEGSEVYDSQVTVWLKAFVEANR